MENSGEDKGYIEIEYPPDHPLNRGWNSLITGAVQAGFMTPDRGRELRKDTKVRYYPDMIICSRKTAELYYSEFGDKTQRY